MDEPPRNNLKLSVQPRTHDISRVEYHVEDLETFGDILTQAAVAAFPNKGKTRYAAVHVLLLSWINDDLGVIDEVLELQEVFQTRYSFHTQEWKIPSNRSHISLALRIMQFLEEFESQENLLIIYYGGHGNMNDDRQCVWSCSSEADSPEVQWYALQTLFEQAKSDVLILLDCCAAASSAAGSATGVTEVIAACGFESRAPGVGEHSFTRSLIEELKYLSYRPPFSAALLHSKVLSRIKYFKPRFATGGYREPRRTPVYIVLANEAKTRSIELAPTVFENLSTTSNGLQVGSSTQVSTPSSEPSNDIHMQSPKSSNYSIDDIWHDAQSNYPKVLISIALEKDQLLRPDEWTEWLKSIPALANTVTVAGAYQSDSTLLLLSLPVAVWDMLPENRAINFIGFVKSTNMISGESWKPLPRINRGTIKYPGPLISSPQRRIVKSHFSLSIPNISKSSPDSPPWMGQYRWVETIDFSPSSSKLSLKSQNPSRAVDQTQSLPETQGTATDGDDSQSQYLWTRAYKALEIQDPDLVAAYACHLDPALYSSTTPSQHALSPTLIEAVIKKKLQDNEARKLVFHLGPESIKVREQGEKIVKFILWSNDFISTTVSAQPYAALAWSGVSVLLPLLLNSSKQKEAMLAGLTSVADLLPLYKLREELYLQAAQKPAHPDLVEAIVQLYTNIFEYQAKLVIYLSRSSIKQGIQSTFEWDDWSGMLRKVQDSDARCIKYTALLDKVNEHRFYMEQSSRTEQSTEVQKHILELFEAFQDSRQQNRHDDKKAKLLQTLASDYKSVKDSISTRVPGTCEWVFKDKRFLRWRDNKKSSLLWICAGPGCGKSVLSRCLIDEKRLCTNVMTSAVCYFFFKDGQAQSSKGSNAISAILHQLFQRKSGSFLTQALSSYDSFGNKLQDAFSELWDILVRSAKDPDAGEIVCVLDALDECEEDARRQLMEKLVGFFSKPEYLENPSLTLKFLVTSRPYEDLDLCFKPISGLDTFTRLDGDEESHKISQDIHLVIDAKVPHIAGDFSAEDRTSISNRLKNVDNPNYLWLFLAINIIDRSRSKYGKKSRIHELLSSLPSSVSDAYEKILSRSSDKDKAKILLQIIAAATRPLTLEEANVALSIATQRSCDSHEKLNLWPSKSFKSTIQNMCGLSISVHDSKIFWIDQTAREFLVSGSNSNAASFREWEGSLNMTTAHGIISQICLQYLNFEEFACISREKVGQNDQSIRKEYPFLMYAGSEWPTHYTSQDNQLAQSSRKDAGMLCRTSLTQLSNWYPIYDQVKHRALSDDWTALGIACWLGLYYVVEDFLNEGADVNAESGFDGTPLIIVSKEGHEDIAELLFIHKVDVDAESEFYGTALIAAAAGGHENIVEMLLSQSANVNANCGFHGTALIAAAAEGYENTVEMLLSQNADINTESAHYGTALIAAAAKGFEKTVEILLNQNADINTASGHYGTALTAAAAGGYEKTVEMLLSQNADINAKGGHYGTALSAAAAGGHQNTVEMLLSQNADINAKGGHYGTALIAAAARGYERIVETLLNQNANVNVKSGYYGTALIAAAARGYERIVETLLNQNANVNVKSGYYGTALIAAAAGGHKKIFDILIDQNATIGKDVALKRASARGHTKVIEILLKTLDIDFEGEIYRNALEKASYYLRVGSVEMLLNKMMDSNVEVEAYDNALEAALKAAEKAETEDLEVKVKVDDEDDEDDFKVDDEDEEQDKDKSEDTDDDESEYGDVSEDDDEGTDWSDENRNAMIEMLKERKRNLPTKMY